MADASTVLQSPRFPPWPSRLGMRGVHRHAGSLPGRAAKILTWPSRFTRVSGGNVRCHFDVDHCIYCVGISWSSVITQFIALAGMVITTI